MPFVTSVERIAKTEGRVEGRVEGGVTVLLKLLAKRWGTVPEEIQQRLHRLPLNQLAALGESLLDFHSRQDLEAWLEAQTQENHET